MGLEQSVVFAKDGVPRWSDVTDLLEKCDFAVQVRMIDGELALPDDTVPSEWHELRISTPSGMITLKRQSDRVVLVAWGNADSKQKQAWNAVAWGFAEVGGGRIESPDGKHDRLAFHRSADLPSTIKKRVPAPVND